MQFPSLQLTPYQGIVFRNLFTCAPSQNLYDDLTNDSTVIDHFVELTSQIDHQLPQFNRPFQYGDLDHEILAPFQKGNWRCGRFGDGKGYGIWYGAEDPLTTVYEACYWTFQLGRDNVFPLSEVYTTDRKMYKASIETKFAWDLSKNEEYHHLLTHPTDYTFCQNLGNEVILKKIEILKTPSARKTDGICVPIFLPTSIKKANFIYYLRIHANPDGNIGVHSSCETMNFSLSYEKLKDPYNHLQKSSKKSSAKIPPPE
jgi:RES domain-containing protein